MQRAMSAKAGLMKAARVLLLLPLLLASLFPAGIMPNVDASGSFSVVICTSDGLRTVTFDSKGNDVSKGENDPLQDDDGQSTGLCVFSVLSGAIGILHVVTDIVAFDGAGGKVAIFATIRLPGFTNSRALGARAPPPVLL